MLPTDLAEREAEKQPVRSSATAALKRKRAHRRTPRPGSVDEESVASSDVEVEGKEEEEHAVVGATPQKRAARDDHVTPATEPLPKRSKKARQRAAKQAALAEEEQEDEGGGYALMAKCGAMVDTWRWGRRIRRRAPVCPTH